MADTPWPGDACSLVDAFRRGERTPVDELEATVAAIGSSPLNAFAHLDVEAARRAAEQADVHRPFGGVPVGVKELEPVTGWPHTEASLVFADRIASYTSTAVGRLRDEGGAVLVGQTTASEFGGLNISDTPLHGTTRNPWDARRSSGGSSAGSAAAVAGGLVTLASGSDGGGSIRIPAAFCGLVGMKGTAGRIPRGPRALVSPLTVVLGCLARSVRDVARYYDVVAGSDARDPYSLPRVEGWERGLGSHLGRLRGARVAITPDLFGSAVVRDDVAELVRTVGEDLADEVGLTIVEPEPVTLPDMGVEWAMTNLVTLAADLEGRWPGCRDQLTSELAFGLELAGEHYTLELAARAELKRLRCNEAVADIFDSVDVLLCATTPDVAFGADVHLNTRVGSRSVGVENNLALTGPFNLVGNPACSVPIGTLAPADAAPPAGTARAAEGGGDEATAVSGLPVGLQIVAPHHDDARVLDLALALERLRPWPQVAPGAPS